MCPKTSSRGHTDHLYIFSHKHGRFGESIRYPKCTILIFVLIIRHHATCRCNHHASWVSSFGPSDQQWRRSDHHAKGTPRSNLVRGARFSTAQKQSQRCVNQRCYNHEALLSYATCLRASSAMSSPQVPIAASRTGWSPFVSLVHIHTAEVSSLD